MVLLDSCHEKRHVLKELEAYGPLGTRGSYIVAMDGIMAQVACAPRTNPDWSWNNPREAALEFVAGHPEFEFAEPPFVFNEGSINDGVIYWPGGYLRRK